MSLVSADDAAMLAIYWLLVTVGAGCLYVWAASRWAKYARRMHREAARRALGAPDRSVHRTGSVVDFKQRQAAQRWP